MRSLPTPEMGQHGAIVGPIFTEFTAAGPRDRPAGEQFVRGGRVVDVGVMHRADDRQAMELAGEQRKMLGDRRCLEHRSLSAETRRGPLRGRRASCPMSLAGQGRPT